MPSPLLSATRPLDFSRAKTSFPAHALCIAVQIALAGMVVPSAMAQTAVAPQASELRAFDLPAAPLAEALQRFAAAAGISVSSEPALVAGRAAAAVKGQYSVEQAFALLLGNTGLRAQPVGAGRYVVADAATAGTLAATTVTASRQRPTAGSSTVISADDLSRRGASDMAEIVRGEPLIGAPAAASGGGNVWDGSGTTGYNIRGLEGNRVSLDVDGIELPPAAPKPDAMAANSFGIGRDYVDPEMFREVRIDSGTTAAGRSGGQGLGGSVAFITKTPEDYLAPGVDRYFSSKFGYSSSNDSTALALTGAQRLGNLQALVVYSHRQGNETENNSAVAPNPDDWKSDALLTKFVWGGDSVHKLGLTLDHYRRTGDSFLNNKTATSYPDGASQQSTTQRTRVSLEHSFTPGQGSYALFDSLQTRVFVQDAKMEDATQARYVTGGTSYQRFIDTGFYNKSFGLTADARKSIGAHSLAYGVALDQTESRRPWTEARYTMAGVLVPASSGTKYRMADTDITRVTAYVRDEYEFELSGHRATLTPGLRAEYRRMAPKNLERYAIGLPAAQAELQTETDTTLLPGLSLAVELTPGFDIYAQYNRGARLPAAVEKSGTYDSLSYQGIAGGYAYAVLGNPELKKETSDAFEFGLKGSPSRGVTLKASAFHTSYKNFIEYAQQPNQFGLSLLYRAENIGDARIWGGEFSSRFELGEWAPAANGYSISVAGGVARSWARNTTTGVTGALPSVAPAKGSIAVGYDDPGKVFGGSLSYTHVAGKKANGDVISGSTTATFAVPSYGVFDLSTYWNISKRTTLTFGIYNLTDQKYWDYATVRSLAATSAAQLAEIERQSQPGRSVAASLNVVF